LSATESGLRAIDKAVSCDHDEQSQEPIVPKTVEARELKTRLGAYLRAVQKGETIVVTERGRPVAELRPLGQEGGGEAAQLEVLATLGLVTRGKGGALPAFKARKHAGTPLSKTIAEGREDRM
jgi:prevent-host-death family protein